MIIKIVPDLQKAKALMQMATITHKRLKETNLEKYPSNTLTDYYDILHQLLEAMSLIIGIKIKGKGAYQELINIISGKEKLKESTRIFIQELRDYRNRINYEGFFVNANYIKQNKAKIEKIISLLFKIIKNKLNN